MNDSEGSRTPSRLETPRHWKGSSVSYRSGYRHVLVLHDIEGHTHEEIARLLDIEPGTSKSQLSRARSLLRRWWSGPAEELRHG